MIHLFQGQTANEVWQRAMDEIESEKLAQYQPGRGGATLEILHAAFSINDPRQRWVVNREPPINPAFALAEVVWIVNGRNESAFLNKWNSQLPKFAGYGKTYHGAYGYRLRHQFGIDQLERAYHALKGNPDGRQIVLQIWDPRTDFPDREGRPMASDIPCNIMAMVKIRGDKLEWTQIMRSNDLFKGTPYNFVQFTSLQEILSGWLELNPGSYHHWSDSLHMYLEDETQGFNHLDLIAATNSDSLALPKEESNKVFVELYQNIESLAKPKLSQDQLYNICSGNLLPQAYKNILLIMAAEAARRKKWFEVSTNLITECSNPILRQSWDRWFQRFHQDLS